MARFKAASLAEYYVIVEDEVGNIVDTGRRNWSWRDLVSAGLISEGDYFVIRHEGSFLRASPDPNTLGWFKKKVIFDNESTRALLSSEEAMHNKANKDHKRWLDKEFTSLRSGGGVFLSNATGLCYLAFGGPTASYSVPN